MTLTTYTDASGLWVNGTTPLDAANMNAIRSFLTASGAMWDSNVSWDGNGRLNAGTAGNSVTGGTSGTATLWQDCTGSIKRVLIYLNNFRTAASNQDIALPVAFAHGGLMRTGFTGDSATGTGFRLLLSGTSETANIVTALSATNIGSTTGETAFFGYGFSEVLTGFDTVRFPASGTSAHTGFIEIVGN